MTALLPTAGAPAGAGGPADEERPIALARFTVKVVADPRPSGCHYWIGAIGDDGYGRFHAGAGQDPQTVHAHRWLYETRRGPLPAGTLALHSCDETSCVRLEHLAAGDQHENLAQMSRRGRAGGRAHAGRADSRGPAGRARAIRAALRDGWDLSAWTAAVADGDPYRHQLRLPLALG